MSGVSEEDIGDVFRIPYFDKASEPLSLTDDVCSFFTLASTDFDVDVLEKPRLRWNHSKFLLQETKKPAHQSSHQGFFALPPGVSSQTPQTPPSLRKGLEEPSPETRLAPQGSQDVFEDWLEFAERPPYKPRYKAWDMFANGGSHHDQPLFITEAGAAAFDAALAAKDDPFKFGNINFKVLSTEIYCACLLALALGRVSILFSWEQSKRSFVPAIDKFRISGASSGSLRGVQDTCIQTGNATQALRSFIDMVYKHNATPSRVSLATTIDKILLVVQSVLGERGQNIKSVLHLESIVRPVYSILIYFRTLVTRLASARNDEEVLSFLFLEAQAQDYSEVAVREVVREVLRKASQPWLSFVEQWVGLKAEEGIELSKDGPGKNFVKVDNRTWVDEQGFEVTEADYVLDDKKMPVFMAPDIAQKLFETGKNIRFLKSNHPTHPLCKPELIKSCNPPKLDWHFDWQSIRKLEASTEIYETDILSVIYEHVTGGLPAIQAPVGGDPQPEEFFGFFGQSGSQMESQILSSIAKLDAPIDRISLKDRLSEILKHRLYGDNIMLDDNEHGLSPHSSLVPVLSFGPLIAAQSKLMDRECMRLLFSAHDLRKHLELQRDFQLMGNGLLASRLSHALFDPDLETAERQDGVARKGGLMGLRLSGRDTWPPASSELRLALMGVLAECYMPHSMPEDGGGLGFKTDKQKLPGDLSFAVRDLTPEEIDACRDPDSISALDFLRLSYKAPGPLATVITPQILAKYDKIFSLLLRVLRMLYVVNQLYKDTVGKGTALVATTICRKFRLEAHHFITSLCSYFLDTGIAGPWKSFARWVDVIQRDLAQNNPKNEPKHIHGPDRLREFHDRVLDQIMLALMLRKRQKPVMKLLEEIFGLILRFGKSVRLEVTGKGNGQKPLDFDLLDLYHAYKQKVDVFVTVCRGLSEKGGFGVKTEKELLNDERSRGGLEENVILRLLVRLEMRSYYAQGYTL